MNEGTVIQPRGPMEIGPGLRLNETYEIVALVGEGGLSQVYRALNIRNRHPVAIKFLRADLLGDADSMELFQREASILAELSHDAIVRYLGFSFDPLIRREYLVMEFVEGLSLEARLRQKPLSAAEAVGLKTRLAGGLSAAHRRGAIHRDMSPDNVILPGDDIDNAKIIDFGIAKALKFAGHTVIGSGLAGKFSYMSPEQVFGGEVTEKSDVYGLGLVLAAALRGEPLDMGKTLGELGPKRSTPPELVGVDPALQPLIAQMLRPNPAERPSMDEVAAWAPKQAPPSAPEKPPAPPSRIGVAAGVVGAFIIGASLVATGWVFRDDLRGLLSGGGPQTSASSPSTEEASPAPSPEIAAKPAPAPTLEAASPLASAPPSAEPTLTPPPSPPAPPPSALASPAATPPHAGAGSPVAEPSLAASRSPTPSTAASPVFAPTPTAPTPPVLTPTPSAKPSVAAAPPPAASFSPVVASTPTPTPTAPPTVAPTPSAKPSVAATAPPVATTFVAPTPSPTAPSTPSLKPSVAATPTPAATPAPVVAPTPAASASPNAAPTVALAAPPAEPPRAPTILTTLDTAYVGRPFRQALPAFQSADPDGLRLAGQGRIPSGLVVTDAGRGAAVIEGTPTRAGTTAFAIVATDSNKRTTTMHAIAIVVPDPSPPVATPAPAPTATFATPAPAQVAAAAAAAGGKGLASLLKRYETIDCWFARTSGPEGEPHVEAVSGDALQLARFADDASRQLGVSIALERVQIDRAQCPALALARDGTGGSRLELVSRNVGGAVPLGGVVRGLAGRGLTVLVVRDNGRTISVKVTPETADSARFNLDITKVDDEDVGRKLVVTAIVSQRALPSLREAGAEQPRTLLSMGLAGELFPKLATEAAEAGASVYVEFVTLARQ